MCFICQACSAVRGWNPDTGTVCGPKLEALTERAESAVAGCRPGWLSQEHGVETPLPHDTLCQACAPRHGVSPSGTLLRTGKEGARTDGQLGCTVPKTSTPQSGELWQGYNGRRPQMTRNRTNHAISHRRAMPGIGTSGTPRQCWHGTVTLKVVPVHGLGGIGMKHRQCVSKSMKKRHLCSQSLCSLGFFH